MEDIKKLLANSYYIDYEDGEFIVALGDMTNDNVEIKSVITFDKKNFEKYINTAFAAMLKYERETGKKFIDSAEYE